jgi:2-haloacid dehalogenase
VPVKAIVFDVGNVLYRWSPRALYERLIPEPQALDVFMRDVLTMEWHAQHDAGRDFADTSAELIEKFPHHRDLIFAWGTRFAETILGPVDGMHELVRELDEAGIPIFGITNFSHEFWPPFRAKEAKLFDCFGDIVVSGDEKLIKPAPAIYTLALRRFGLETGEGFFIDDSLPNVESARENGFVAHHFEGVAGVRAELRTLGVL